MVLGFALYGYAATRARPALRDPRLLCLVYVNTFLIESLVSFQMAFVYACVFFFLFIEAVDKRHWVLPTLLAIATVSTHPFAGGVSVAGYVVYAVVRRPADLRPLFAAMAIAAIALAPFALYIRTAPAVGTTSDQDLIGTLRFIARYRGLVILLPLIVSAFAPAFRTLFVVIFVAMALTFVQRIDAKKVNTFGIAAQLAHVLRRVSRVAGVRPDAPLPRAGAERPRGRRLPSDPERGRARLRSSSTRASFGDGGTRPSSTPASSARSRLTSCCSSAIIR